ncbi:MAG: ATP-binding cassette domain-containing protein, partial [Candidatus Marinimicrobia bacterium]|nr:ATP-binding cassette domain-containing protein [Candidatus Neomarinimicrobiota bacterium]
GKSTLLNIMGALTGVDQGKVLFNNQDLASMNPVELAHYRNQDIGFVFQQHFLLPQMTLLENILMPTLAFYQKADVNDLKQRALKLLARVDLLKRMDHRPGQCSGGECQRAAVVRALINTPQLLLADEPTGSLDQQAAENLATLLLELNAEEKVGIVLVTHSTKLVARIPEKYALANGNFRQL